MSRLLPLLLTCVALCGCGASPVLGPELPVVYSDLVETAPELELVSLDPAVREGGPGAPPDAEWLHGFLVIGRAQAGGPSERAGVLKAVRAVLSEDPGMVAGCFLPRHALRARAGERWCDVLLCLECLSARAYGSEGEPAWGPAHPRHGAALSARYLEHGLRIAD